MIPELRRQFLAQWTPERYRQFLYDLDTSVGQHIEFRISETPVFYPQTLLDKMVLYGQEICAELHSNGEYQAASERIIPESFRVPNEPPHPLFVQADFGLIQQEDGSLEPKLVEIQGFPSIYALQCAMAEAYSRNYRLPSHLCFLLDGLDKEEFVSVLRRAIVGDHHPADVVLLEVDPHAQKTAPDFLETQRLLGIRVCPIDKVQKRGRELVFDGRSIRRIYNRVIVDDLVRRDVKLSFDITDDLEVEWAGHPNWFFKLSKFSLPWLKHPCVPATRFLYQVKDTPPDLDRYVLKPLFSFAGSGVVVGPTRSDISAISEAHRHEWILQERMHFVPTLETPSGPTVVETRIMYIHNGQRLQPVTTVVRTGRGKMMGVDFNKNLDWVGASAGFFPAAD